MRRGDKERRYVSKFHSAMWVSSIISLLTRYDMQHSKADGSQFNLTHDSKIKNES